MAVARGIGNCELIANDVRRGPLARSLAFPYHPHVTVAHDVPSDMLELAYSGLAELSAEFRVEHFTEFEQTPTGGVGRRPRVPADRPGSLIRPRAPELRRQQTRSVTSAPPARDPWYTRAYAWGEGRIRAMRRRWSWFDHLMRAGGRYRRTQGDLMAAGVTYFAFLGLFPVLLLAASIVGLVLAGNDAAAAAALRRDPGRVPG